MNLVHVAKRFIFSSKNFSYTNISLYLSILTFALSIAISLIVMGVSRSYKSDIEIRLQSIEPDLKIINKNSKFLDLNLIDKIILELDSISVNNPNLSYSRFREDYLMIKSSEISKGLFSFSFEKHPSVFFDFLRTDEALDNYLYISDRFRKNNSLELSKNITLFNIQEMIEDETLRANSFLVSDIFFSDLPIFDNNVIFISPQYHSTLYNNSNQSTGIVIDGIDQNEINIIKNKFLYDSIDFITWKDKHANTLYWLTIFTNPIYLIVIFMIILSIIYQLFANWLLIYDKSNSLYQLRLLGISDNKIKIINIYISLSILFISLFLGYIIAVLMSFLQNQFSIISVDPYIYIVSELSSKILLSDFIIISIISCVTVVASTLLLYNKRKLFDVRS
tara:strand:+ start:44291 stop:45466 length:1176 start_codon:yes stop_codon:yes gene_type:complete